MAFWGLYEYDGDVNDLLVLRGGLQARIGRSIFLQAATNGLWTGFRPEDPSTVLGERFVIGYGGTVGLRGLWGILQVGLSSNAVNHAVIGWFNLGFRI
jgi:hypothetical protein